MKKELYVLQLCFKHQLPEQINAIEHLWFNCCEKNNAHLIELQNMLHTLQGTASSYGAIKISFIANEALQKLSSRLSELEETEHSSVLSDVNSQSGNGLFSQLRLAAEEWEPSFIPFIDGTNAKKTKNNKIVYLVDDDISFSNNLVLTLEGADYCVRHFLTIDEFEEAIKANLPDIVIMDMVFHESEIAGAEVIGRLKVGAAIFPPVIFLSMRNDMEARLAALRSGSDCYFTKSSDIKQLVQTLDRLTEEADVEAFKVIIVDDSEDMLLYYETILQYAGINVKTQIDPLKCLAMLPGFKPDLLILDVFMPGCSGIELAQVIRQDDNWAFIPILFLTSESSPGLESNAMMSGVDQFLTKPIDPEYFISVVNARAKRARWIYNLNNDLKVAVRDSQFLLSTMNEHDLVSCTDIDGRITSVNDRFCEVSGYTANELLGQTHSMLKSDFHPDSFYQGLWQTISRGKVWHGTICNRKKNGEAYWAESTIVPFLDEQGKPYKYVSARTDVTSHRESEDRLQRSQIFANIGTWDWNIQTGNIFWSERIWSLFGFDKKVVDPTYHNFLLAIHSDDRQKVIDAANSCIAHGAKFDIEHRIVWPDSTIHWLHESGDVIRNTNGKATNMLGVVRDITQRKMAEKKLSETEKRFTFAVEGAGDGVWDWNIDSNEIKFSQTYMEMLGFKIDELPHHFDTWRSLVHPDDINPILLKLNDYLKGNSAHFSEELRLRCKNNEYKWILCRGNLSNKDNSGKPCRMIGIHTDISQRKQEQKELITAREFAEKANRTKSQFLSNMSHELRTPLNAIIGFSQLLKTDPINFLSENQQENVEEILKAGKHLLELINEVLDLARIEAGEVNLSIGTVIVSEIIAETLQLISPLAEKRGIDICFVWHGANTSKEKLFEQVDTVQADRTKLKQVLLNLLSNAIKYNIPDGKIIITFEIINDKASRISVTDTGHGLTPEQQAKLFNSFNRLGVENNEEIEGTGIGLVITKKIVELMGGVIGVKSEPGDGCCFWIELLSQNSSESREKISSTSEPVIINKGLIQINKTVLYVEDNPANLRLVTQLIGRLPGVHLWTANESLLGVELALEHEPDLILLDINMPGMNGIEVLKHLRQREATKKIPVIAISANAMETDIKNGLAAGFDEYITKPIDLKLLLKSVENALK